MSEFASERLARICRCGACGGKIGRLNLMTLQRRATWEFPTSHNLVTNYGPCAVAVLCDGCIDANREPREVVELAGDSVRYHPIESLQVLPPEPTAVIRRSAAGDLAIYCLVCGRTSFNPNDVLNRYCVHCHKYHSAVVEAPP